ncbi:hypothetical protein CHCC20375_0934 [Bacillus licheniformis]|nr:hypothetical protein [Bacillus haynesii]MCY8554549.1 hypothetical protein [Bacillus haynesii]TWK12761.1 hypothetical protein CHCC20375_0934 [Bacillus licheniformis]
MNQKPAIRQKNKLTIKGPYYKMENINKIGGYRHDYKYQSISSTTKAP